MSKVEKKVIKKVEVKPKKVEIFNGNGLRYISYKLFTYECESISGVSAKGFFRTPHVQDFGVLSGALILCTSEKEAQAKLVVAV